MGMKALLVSFLLLFLNIPADLHANQIKKCDRTKDIREARVISIERYLIYEGHNELFAVNKERISRYEDSFVSFSYPASWGVSKNQIDKDLTQLVLIHAAGHVITILEYSSLNPEDIVEILFNGFVREFTETGYEARKKNIEVKSANAKRMRGIESFFKGKRIPAEIYITLVAHGFNDRGVVIILSSSSDAKNFHKTDFNFFWESLIIK
jgi:hypothetical protein